MKITHVNLGDSSRQGGTSVATIRLHQALKDKGIESEVLCGFLDENLPQTSLLPKSLWVRLWEAALRPMAYELGLNDLYAVRSFFLKQTTAFKQTDLLHLHCIHHGYFNYLALPTLTAEKPAIYTMHDIWAFTGHCAISYRCDRWKTGCGQCPDLTIMPAVKRDTTQLQWQLKRWVYQRSNLYIVSPSTWITDQLKHSILSHLPTTQIPHGVDIWQFYPLESEQCRAVLKIPVGKRVLMTVGSKSFFKGGDLLPKILKGLPVSLQQELILLVMSTQELDWIHELEIDVVQLGNISNDNLKAIAYSAADLFLFPTRGESFGLVALESLACETPVVAFSVGGVPDVVRHDKTGYLAPPEDVEAFRQGILQLLEDDDLRRKLGQQGRQMAVDEFSLELEARRYIELYEKVLSPQT